MPFLESLRLANIFPRRPATDRPFGMPEIDSGNIASMFRSTVPLAESLNRDDAARQAGLVQLANNLRRPQASPGMMTRGTGIERPAGGRGTPFNPNVNTRLGPETGPTPTQSLFLRRGQQQEAEEDAQLAGNINLMRTQDMKRDEHARDMESLDKKIQAETSLFSRKHGAEKELAGMRFGHEKDIATSRIRSAEQIARDNAISRGQDVVNRERVRGEEARKTQSEKPPLATQQDDAFRNRVQSLAIDNPDAAKLIEKGDDGIIRVSEDATPEQAAWIKNYLSGQSKPKGTGQVMKRRHKKTGAIEVSQDGGKTWTKQ